MLPLPCSFVARTSCFMLRMTPRTFVSNVAAIDVAVGYSKTNSSAILKLFLSRLDELRAPMPEKSK